jgi:predicted XRE-type DNA-binding protein
MNVQETISWLIEQGCMKKAQIARNIGVTAQSLGDMASGRIGHTRPSSKVVDGLRKLRRQKERELAKAEKVEA